MSHHQRSYLARRQTAQTQQTKQRNHPNQPTPEKIHQTLVTTRGQIQTVRCTIQRRTLTTSQAKKTLSLQSSHLDLLEGHGSLQSGHLTLAGKDTSNLVDLDILDSLNLEVLVIQVSLADQEGSVPVDLDSPEILFSLTLSSKILEDLVTLDSSILSSLSRASELSLGGQEDQETQDTQDNLVTLVLQGSLGIRATQVSLDLKEVQLQDPLVARADQDNQGSQEKNSLRSDKVQGSLMILQSH